MQIKSLENHVTYTKSKKSYHKKKSRNIPYQKYITYKKIKNHSKK